MTSSSSPATAPKSGEPPQASQLPPSTVPKRLIAAGMLGLAAGCALGYGLGRATNGPLAAIFGEQGGYQEGYVAGYGAAKKKLADSGMFPPTPTSSLALIGKVKEMGASSIIVNADLTGPNPLEPLPGPEQRTVNITPDTKILLYTGKTPAELEQEALSVQAGTGQVPKPFEPHAIKPIALSEVSSGEMIHAIADHNILNAAEFTAKEVRIYR